MKTSELMRSLREKQYPQLSNVTYLDYTASAPFPQSLLQIHVSQLQSSFQSNPHSETAPSTLSSSLMQETKQQILDFFNASDEYTVVFTANATAAAKLVGEAFPFRRRSRLVLSQDNHNSVVGIRCFAGRNHARVSYLPLDDEFRLRDTDLPFATVPSLFAFPAQSNFTGVRHDCELVCRAQKRGYYVLLDAAAFVPTSRLDLSKHPADFITISFYKMFGYPTGIGALIAKKSSLSMLSRPAFSGGTVEWVSTHPGKHVMLQGEEAFHDGTPHFLGIPAVSAGLKYLSSIRMELINAWVSRLTKMLLDGMVSMKDVYGNRQIKIYGPESTENRGGTVSFDVLNEGKRVTAELVSDRLSSQGVCVRTGCFCNPGCGEHALSVKGRMRRCFVDGVTKKQLSNCMEKELSFLRVSIGLGALEEDIVTFLKHLREICDEISTWDERDLSVDNAKQKSRPEQSGVFRLLKRYC